MGKACRIHGDNEAHGKILFEMPLKKGLTENCWSNWVFMGVYKADLRQ
jgi:hypothetical protein